MKRTIIVLLFFGLLSACASNRTQYYNKPQEDIFYGVVEDSLAQVDMAYIGALGRHFIFECRIRNNSAQVITIDQSDFALYHGVDEELLPIVPSEVVLQLEKDQVALKKRKKINVIAAVVSAGLNSLAGATTGASVGEVIAYSAEPFLYAAEDNAWANRDINSVEDEIKYLERQLFANSIIAPQSELTRDVLFPITRIEGDAALILYLEGQPYEVVFSNNLFEL